MVSVWKQEVQTRDGVLAEKLKQAARGCSGIYYGDHAGEHVVRCFQELERTKRLFETGPSAPGRAVQIVRFLGPVEAQGNADVSRCYRVANASRSPGLSTSGIARQL